jgi:hypothetical protein
MRLEHSIICTMPDVREDELESARIADRSARDALANITSTSVAGAAALLRYVAVHAVENEQGDIETWPAMFPHVAERCRRARAAWGRAMTRTAIAIVALLLSSLPAQAQVINLSCEGEIRATPSVVGMEIKPEPITKMGLVVNLDNHVVIFNGHTTRIDKIDDQYVSFKGREDYSGSVWNASGSIDRITGFVSAMSSLFNPKTNKFIMGPDMWELYCKPVRPLF